MSADMRKIAAVTGSRADYGLLSGVLRRIENDPDLDLHSDSTPYRRFHL